MTGSASDRTTITDTIIDDSITVKIAVRDRDEPPASAHGDGNFTRPRWQHRTLVPTTLTVNWHAKNTGPDIDRL